VGEAHRDEAEFDIALLVFPWKESLKLIVLFSSSTLCQSVVFACGRQLLK
jgi:hypothetical protein